MLLAFMKNKMTNIVFSKGKFLKDMFQNHKNLCGSDSYKLFKSFKNTVLKIKFLLLGRMTLMRFGESLSNKNTKPNPASFLSWRLWLFSNAHSRIACKQNIMQLTRTKNNLIKPICSVCPKWVNILKKKLSTVLCKLKSGSVAVPTNFARLRKDSKPTVQFDYDCFNQKAYF
jgi:hypothetical protein